MHPLRNWRYWIIGSCGAMGASYGLIASQLVNQETVNAWGILISVVAGAALCASGASAICRLIDMVVAFRGMRNHPVNHLLCYRGVYVIPVTEFQEYEADISRLRQSSI